MFRTKSLFLQKYKLVGHRKAYFYLILCLITISIIACNSSGSNNTEASKDSTSNEDTSNGNSIDTSLDNARMVGLKAIGLNAIFHDLYLTKAEFNIITTRFNPNPYKKFVFQFFFPEDGLEGSPTLALWPSKIHNSEFTDKPQQILHYALTSDTIPPKSLYLGDLQTDVNILKKAIDTTMGCNEKCVLFFSLKNDSTLSYDIYLIKDSTTIINRAGKELDLTNLTPVGTANPSPPKVAN